LVPAPPGWGYRRHGVRQRGLWLLALAEVQMNIQAVMLKSNARKFQPRLFNPLVRRWSSGSVAIWGLVIHFETKMRSKWTTNSVNRVARTGENWVLLGLFSTFHFSRNHRIVFKYSALSKK